MDSMSVISVFLSAAVSIVLVACLFKLTTITIKLYKKSAILKKFPHNPIHWLWGHMQEIPRIPNEEGLKYKRETAGRHPDGYLVWFGPLLPWLCLNSPLSTKPILKSAEPKGNLYRLLIPWLGDGLLLSSGEKWARNRRLLTPAFHFEILKPYLQIKNKAADVLCSKISGFADTNEYFEECSVIAMFTLDVILKCAFSYKTNCQEIGTGHPYVKAVEELSKIVIRRLMNPLLHPDWIFFLTQDGRNFKKHCNFVHNVAEEIILQRRDFLKQKNPDLKSAPEKKRYTDFLDILLMAHDENNVGLTDKEIRDEVDTFLFEGHDTTASAIYWTLYSIAQHGSIQDRVQKEIDSLMVGRETDDLLSSDMNQLPYLTMCIKESLRLHCVVSYIMRQTTQEFEICGKLLPKDTMANIDIYSVHHNPTIWEDSLEFRPERFSPDNIDKINTFAYIPFSAGPRNCIGQNFAMHEIKVLLVKILRRFFLEVDPSHAVQKIESLVMRAENGIKLKATHRQSGEYRFD